MKPTPGNVTPAGDRDTARRRHIRGTTPQTAGPAPGRPMNRVAAYEEGFELRVPLPDVVSMQTRQPDLGGAGGVPLRRLAKETRMRPSRVVVGEARQHEWRLAAAHRPVAAAGFDLTALLGLLVAVVVLLTTGAVTVGPALAQER